MAEPPLLLDARRLGVALRDDEPAELIAEFARHFLPHRLSEEVAESDRAIDDRIGQENAPAVLRKTDVLEVRPPGRDRRSPPCARRPGGIPGSPAAPCPPPLDVLRLPVLERPLQTLVEMQVDVVRDFIG